MPRDYLTVADVLGMHTVLMQRYGGALMESVAINYPFVDGNERIAFAAADLFLRFNGWRPQRSPMQIHAEMMRMFETGTFDIAHLVRGCAGLRGPNDDIGHG